MKTLTQIEIIELVDSLDLLSQPIDYSFQFHGKTVFMDFNILIRAIIDIGFEYPNRPKQYQVLDEKPIDIKIITKDTGYNNTFNFKTVQNKYIRKSFRFNDCYFQHTEPEKLVASNIEHNYSLFGGIQCYVTEYTKRPSYHKLVLNIPLLKDKLVKFLMEVQPLIINQDNKSNE